MKGVAACVVCGMARTYDARRARVAGYPRLAPVCTQCKASPELRGVGLTARARSAPGRAWGRAHRRGHGSNESSRACCGLPAMRAFDEAGTATWECRRCGRPLGERMVEGWAPRFGPRDYPLALDTPRDAAAEPSAWARGIIQRVLDAPRAPHAGTTAPLSDLVNLVGHSLGPWCTDCHRAFPSAFALRRHRSAKHTTISHFPSAALPAALAAPEQSGGTPA